MSRRAGRALRDGLLAILVVAAMATAYGVGAMDAGRPVVPDDLARRLVEVGFALTVTWAATMAAIHAILYIHDPQTETDP